jgi:hypothetical protein
VRKISGLIGAGFVTSAAFQFVPEPAGAPFRRQDPFAYAKRRFMTNMLGMTAIEDGTPVAFVVLLEVSDVSLHGFRTKPLLVRRSDAGFHQRNIVRAISQHTAEATISGTSWPNSRASAASIAADNIQSCAMLIITSSASRACQIAVRPRTGGRRAP